MPTFADILSRRVNSDPSRPLVTFYDHASDERTELSVVTFANWVAKTASYLCEVCDLERGDTVRINLGAHWLTPIFLGAAWSVGCIVDVSENPSTEPDAMVAGPDSLDALAQSNARAKIASALHPLGLRFSEPLPSGVVDFGAEVWSQPDSFIPYDPPSTDDLATNDSDNDAGLTHGALWHSDSAAARREDREPLDGQPRLLTTLDPAASDGVDSFCVPLVLGGSIVWVRNLDEARLHQVAQTEKTTHLWH